MPSEKVERLCNLNGYCNYRTPDQNCTYESYCDFQAPRDSRKAAVD
jgi:hypothetical protein